MKDAEELPNYKWMYNISFIIIDPLVVLVVNPIQIIRFYIQVA